MQIFGLAFLLYYLKLSDGSGYWMNLRNSDEDSYKQAVKIQRMYKKVVRCELAIKFLTRCRDANVFPKFTRWKNANKKDIKARNKYRRKVLLDEIRTKHQQLKTMKNEVEAENVILYNNMTYMKKRILKWSIDNTSAIERRLVTKRHDKKFNNLMQEKSLTEGTQENPNKTIWNFSSHILTNEEYETLKFGLKHGLAKQPYEDDILASAESLWYQIESKGICKEGAYYQRQAKNQLRAMAFNLINLEEKQIYEDKKKINIIRKLKEKVVLLGPDKGNGVVIMDINDYKDSMSHLFEDRSKFRILQDDPTNTRFNSLQDFLRKLRKRGEIDEEEFKAMFPKNAKIGRAHGTAKVHKEFERIPPLRPIVDTIGSTHYGVGKFITKLLNPLTQNQYALKDSFDAADKIRAIPNHLYDEGYQLVSFDVKSLFTNVPLNKTIEVILDRVYNKKLIETNLKKRTLKKLILDTCSKTAFLCNNVIYEQKDGVSMGASLGPVLANIIMTELERAVVDKLIANGTIKFYARYVDDTLLLVKPEKVDEILSEFNKFHRYLEFTVDKFEDCVPHFLDLDIQRDGISIYRKETHTAQFVHFDSYTKWGHKIAWIRSLVNRAKKLCSPSKLADEIRCIQKFASYNGFPKWTAKRIIKEAMSSHRSAQDTEDVAVETLHISLPYNGKQAENIVLRCKKRLKKLFKRDKTVKFEVSFQSTKVAFFTSNKDRIPKLSNSSVIYQYTCPGCAKSYVGKTENTLFNRTKQHGWSQKDSAVCKHFDECSAWKEVVDLFQIDGDNVDKMQFQVNAVRDSTRIIASANNWLTLAFKESLSIKHLKPELNKGLKSCKELALF